MGKLLEVVLVEIKGEKMILRCQIVADFTVFGMFGTCSLNQTVGQ